MKHATRQWLIRGYNSQSLIFEYRVDCGRLTFRQMEALLKTLVAKAGLTSEEIVGAYATRRTKVANDLLHGKWDHMHSTFSCGTNPFFTATLVAPLKQPSRASPR